MKVLFFIIAFVFINKYSDVTGTIGNSYCRKTLEGRKVEQINWTYLKDCLLMVNGEVFSRNTSENIWRLMKLAFEDIESIPSEAYKYMGNSLIFIPLDDLRNISMENVDVVEAFGAIRSHMPGNEKRTGFSTEQLNVIAQKVRTEWLGKNPQTYSEYDLKTMGEILCYLNATDLEKIQADAFKEAAERIGEMEECPIDRLQALANVAKRSNGFGDPRKWSKYEVSIIGNVINGLSANDINSIAKSKLRLNNFYRPQATNNTQSTKNTPGNSGLTNATVLPANPTNSP